MTFTDDVIESRRQSSDFPVNRPITNELRAIGDVLFDIGFLELGYVTITKELKKWLTSILKPTKASGFLLRF